MRYTRCIAHVQFNRQSVNHRSRTRRMAAVREKRLQPSSSTTLTGSTSLHDAVERGDCDAIAALMKHDAALTAPVIRQHERAREEEEEEEEGGGGGGVAMVDNFGATCLHYGATRGEWRAMRAVLDASPSRQAAQAVAARDNDGRTALHWAAANGKEEAVRLLLSRGADVHAKDEHGRAALHSAARAGSVGVVRVLVAGGASLNAAGEDGKTPLALARAAGWTECARVLRQMVRPFLSLCLCVCVCVCSLSRHYSR